MDIQFVTALYNFEIIGNLGRGDKILDSTFITNDTKIINSLIDAEVAPIIGNIEVDAINNAKVVIYSNETLPPDMTPDKYLIIKLYQVQTFLSSTWLYDNNSINDEVGYLIYHDKNRTYVTSNSIPNVYTMPNGQSTYCKMSRETLREVRNFYREFVDIPILGFSKPVSLLTKGNSRISRTLYHIVSSRAESDILLKITGYCSALETLFSTNQAELSHQLSERVAFFLGDSPEERITLFRNAKKAYALRSKIVHGNAVKSSELEKVIESSEFCDSILRKILRIIISSEKNLGLFSENPPIIDEYFLGLIFGLNEPMRNI